MDVYLTADVEIWCDGWENIDAKFSDAFKKYVYGETSNGFYGLEYQLQILKAKNLKCTFFVEPLFSMRFGQPPLKEIVDLIQSYNQRVELHIHTEWLDEAEDKLLPEVTEKRQHIRHFDIEQQTKIIAKGKELLEAAGVDKISAFRAGSFAFNLDTLKALRANDIFLDSSYNETQFARESGLAGNHPKFLPFTIEGIMEYPMSIFDDKLKGLRHAQLTACSSAEIRALLQSSLELNIPAFTFLFHNFELLTPSGSTEDPIVVSRFSSLCDFLDENRERMPTLFLSEAPAPKPHDHIKLPESTPLKTLSRMAQQLYRKRYE